MEIVCNNVERLITTEVRPRGLTRGAICGMYGAARGDGPPLGVAVGQALMAHQGKRVGIFTGAPVPVHMPNGENDGPLGSIVAGRALERIGCRVTYYAERELFPIMEELIRQERLAARLKELSKTDRAANLAYADETDLGITIEKQGATADGHMYSINANNRDHTRANIDNVIAKLTADGKVTIGVGDGGNEIGYGKIHEYIVRHVPFGPTIACTIQTTHLYPAAVSNWGGYALAALIALHTGDLTLCHTPERELEYLDLTAKMRVMDGGTGQPINHVDGIPAAVSAGVVTILRGIVEAYHRKPFERQF
jgi:hypothetical protein